MKQARREIQVGLTVVISILVLIAGIFWFERFRVGAGMVDYEVDFPTVEALKPGDRVQVRGIRMGAVDDLQLVGNSVRVRFHVEMQADLREDAKLSLQTVGIVGEKVINIIPGTGAPAPAGYVFQGQTGTSITEMAGMAQQTMDAVQSLAQDVAELLNQIQGENRLASILEETRQTMGDVRHLVADNRQDLHELIVNLQAISGAVRRVVAGPDSSLGEGMTAARQTLAHADSVMSRLDTVVGSLQGLAVGLDRGEGTAGRLLRDDELYLRAEMVLHDLSELISDIKRDPKRYFKLSVFDF
jgi:phospholipid/cholesterol/gamma-HCH transport system substrate-binding protein